MLLTDRTITAASGLRGRVSPQAALVTGITLAGLAFRLSNFGQSLFGDELSTTWIVTGKGLGHVLATVRSNDEITPPLFFVLAWLSSKLGSNLDLLRLPSLVAGTLTIPLVYALGRRLAGELTGVFAATVVAMNPFLIYYSTEARAYAVVVALLVASCLALLSALESGGGRRWLLYAVLCAACMYTHYTAVFPLAAQTAWALWFYPRSRQAVLVATAGAALLFAPWIPGYIGDSNSPTTAILSALQPFNAGAVRSALGNWAVGYPYVGLRSIPGSFALVLVAAGLLAAVFAVGARARTGPSLRPTPGITLIALLALSAPVGEFIYSAVGTNLLGARGLIASSAGLALGLGALLASVKPPRLAAGLFALVAAGSLVGAIKTTETKWGKPAYDTTASFIDRRARPTDVVVDASWVTPGPLTGLELYLDGRDQVVNLGLPSVSHPFMLTDPVPDPDEQIAAALRAARAHRLFLVYSKQTNTTGQVPSRALALKLGERLLERLPRSYSIVGTRTFDGLTPLTVVEVAGGTQGR